MLDDIIQATRQTLLERIASPLLGSFALAWCVWNWKFLVILFSTATVSQTFALVEQVAFPDPTTIALKGVLLPLLSAIAYVFAYPFPARYVYEFTLKRQRELNETKRRIADETPLTIEESRRLRAEYVEYERKQTAIIEELHEEVARLNAALDERKTKPELPQLSTAERLYDRIEPTQIKILKLLQSVNGKTYESEIIKKSGKNQIKAEFDLGELLRRGLISREYTARGYIIEFTHEGRRVLLEQTAPEVEISNPTDDKEPQKRAPSLER